MKLSPNNVFELLPTDLDKEVVESIVNNGNVKIQRIISKGHTSPASGWYDQSQAEWVIVLQGEAIITFENEKEVHLVVGSYLNIPAHSKHKVKWTKPETETIWLVVHH